MKAYLLTTGIAFALVTLAHIRHVFAEGPRLAKDPIFLFLTLLAAGLSVWAWRLLRSSPPPQPPSWPARPEEPRVKTAYFQQPRSRLCK